MHSRRMMKWGLSVLVILALTACSGEPETETGATTDEAGFEAQLSDLEERVAELERARSETDEVGEVDPASAEQDASEAHEEPDEHEEAPHWGYEGDTGPDAWGELDPSFAACADGTEQSPINLDEATATAVGLDDIETRWEPTAIEVIDNGHTVQANVPAGNTTVIDGVEYQLLQFHFHKPSEHTTAGAVSPLEAHFVHADADENLAVVGVMLEVGAGNRLLSTVLDARAEESGDPVAVGEVDLERLLPESRTRYAYAGSLTTPPCTEGVSWNVLDEPVTVSQEQVDAFPYSGNARPVQSAGDRHVLRDRS